MAFLFYIVLLICLSILLQLIIHEFGHYIGGLLTGWHLIYLQIFRIAIVKKEKYLKCKVVDSSGFQCIMYPDSVLSNAIIYTIGGCILNLLVAVISFLCMFFVFRNPYLWLLFWCLFISGIAFFIMNIKPHINTVCNDGASYLLLKSDKRICMCHNNQLIIAKHLYNGLTYQQINKEIICMSPEVADNDLYAYQALLEYYYWLDVGNDAMMREALARIDITSTISENVLDIICLESLYVDLYMNMAAMQKEPVDLILYGGNIPTYILEHDNGDIHSRRIKAAYEAFEGVRNGDYYMVLNGLENTVRRMKVSKSIYLGEVRFCIDQINKISRFIEDRLTNHQV
jgi:hypothetical protein